MNTMTKSYAMPALAILFMALAPHARADRGSIPFYSDVTVFEPNQRAVIAWNGEEEILLLSTDLRASKPTKVLEVIPLPNEPKVTKGDVEVFRKATALINQKLAQEEWSGPSRGGHSLEKAQPAGEITFHEKIGTHDISVVRVLQPERFVEWVNAYLNKAGVGNPVIPPVLQKTVDEYTKEHFTWFVFDVVELDDQPKTNDAIQYRFKTGSLFYPMKISRTDTGKTEVNLMVLTPKTLKSFPGIGIKQVELMHSPVNVSMDEIKALNPDIANLLGKQEEMKLRIWRIRGDLASFDKDLLAQ